ITNSPPLPIPYSLSVMLGQRMLPFLALLLCVAFLQLIPTVENRERQDSRALQMRLTRFIMIFVLLLLTLHPGKNIDLSSHLALRCLGSLLILLGLGQRIWTSGSVQLERVLYSLIFKSSHLVFLSTLSFCFILAALLFCGLVLGFLPHVADSMSLLWQGKIFAAGRLSIPALPREIQPFFVFFYAITGDSLYSIYPPGQPLLFAIGCLLGAPYLVSPLLGAGSLVGIYLVGRQIADDAIGRLSALLASFSPFLLFMSGSFMAHTGTLFFNTFGTYFFLRLVKPKEGSSACSPSRRLSFLDASACGFCFGMAFLCRPYTTAAFFPVILAGSFWFLIRNRWRNSTSFLLAGLIAAIFLVGFMFYNQKTTGDPLTTGYQVGSSMEQFSLQWSPANGVRNTATNFSALHLLLFAWPVPSLFAVWWLLQSRRMRRTDIYLLLMGLAPVAAYFFYSFQDLCYGPRFFYTSSLFFIVLSARALMELRMQVRHICRGIHPLPVALTLVCFVFTVLRIAPNMNSYWQASPERTVQKVRDAGITDGLVLVDRWDALPTTLNSISFDSRIVYALNRGHRNLMFLHWYPDRDIYHVRPEGVTPVRILSQAEPGERLHNDLLREKLSNPTLAYQRLDTDLDEEIMNRIISLEKTPFLWADMVLDNSDQVFIMDVWGRVYRRDPDRIRMLNTAPFKGINRTLIATSFCLNPTDNSFTVLDQRGGIYQVSTMQREPEVLELPNLSVLTLQIEYGSEGYFLVLCEDGSVLRWNPDSGYHTVSSSPETENVEYRMCVFDDGRAIVTMDTRGALYLIGSAQTLVDVPLGKTWDWEAARAIRYLGTEPASFVTMDAFGAIYIRGEPGLDLFTENLPYNTSWEYAVDIEIGKDSQTLYLLNRNGEVWLSRPQDHSREVSGSGF
ncbi:MAG TPA: glycosyltransferase family 39 protein, partial [bacterium]|nr:glycosyltransferase family 39 protein [bacterium]